MITRPCLIGWTLALCLLGSLATTAHSQDSDSKRETAQLLYDQGLKSMGMGTPNHVIALKRFQQASALGHVPGTYMVGRVIKGGRWGVRKNLNEALKWYKLAAEKKHPDAASYLMFHYIRQNNFEETLKFAKIAAEGGNSDAPNMLGWMYDNGKGVKTDHAEALKWFRKGAALGDAEAATNTGEMNELGKGTAKDPKEAAKWYLRGAQGGFYIGMLKTAECYQKGMGVEADPATALKWLYAAKKRGAKEAPAKIDAFTPKPSEEMTQAAMKFANDFRPKVYFEQEAINKARTSHPYLKQQIGTYGGGYQPYYPGD